MASRPEGEQFREEGAKVVVMSFTQRHRWGGGLCSSMVSGDSGK
jgi:hypothetical protein